MEDENRDIIASMNSLQKPYSFFTLDDWDSLVDAGWRRNARRELEGA